MLGLMQPLEEKRKPYSAAGVHISVPYTLYSYVIPFLKKVNKTNADINELIHNKFVTVCLSAWTKGIKDKGPRPEPKTRFNRMLHVYMFPFVHPSIYYKVFFYESILVSVSCKCIASCLGPSREIVCNISNTADNELSPVAWGPAYQAQHGTC